VSLCCLWDAVPAGASPAVPVTQDENRRLRAKVEELHEAAYEAEEVCVWVCKCP
jgi:hypothetical protein